MTSILDLADRHANAIAKMGERAIADLHAAGIPAYVGNVPDAGRDEIVRLDPDGRRFVVLIDMHDGGDDVIVRELAPSSDRT